MLLLLTQGLSTLGLKRGKGGDCWLFPAAAEAMGKNAGSFIGVASVVVAAAVWIVSSAFTAVPVVSAAAASLPSAPSAIESLDPTFAEVCEEAPAVSVATFTSCFVAASGIAPPAGARAVAAAANVFKGAAATAAVGGRVAVAAVGVAAAATAWRVERGPTALCGLGCQASTISSASLRRSVEIQREGQHDKD